MSRTTDDPLEDTGLDWSDVAKTASVVYARVVGLGDEAQGEEVGWDAVARAAAAMFAYDEGADDGEVQIPLVQLAGQLRRAYARAVDTDGDICEWGSLGAEFQLAWEGVTRHLSNVFGMDKAEASRLGHHEARMVNHMAKQAAARAASTRG